MSNYIDILCAVHSFFPFEVIIYTEGALRRPLTYDNQFLLYSAPEGTIWMTKERLKGGGRDGSVIKMFWSNVLDGLWSKKICKPEMIIWSPVLNSLFDVHDPSVLCQPLFSEFIATYIFRDLSPYRPCQELNI